MFRKTLCAVSGAVALSCAWGAATAADHIDAPFTTGTPNADINDLYAFTRGDNVVLAMTIHPFADATTRLNPDYLYQFKFDTDQDNLEDLVLQVRAQGTGDNQTYSIAGPASPEFTGATGNTAAPSRLTSTFNTTTNDGQLTAFVGLRDDPFFFDLAKYQSILDDVRQNGQITQGGFDDPGADTLAGANTVAIVIELPRSAIATGPVGIWATSSRLQ